MPCLCTICGRPNVDCGEQICALCEEDTERAKDRLGKPASDMWPKEVRDDSEASGPTTGGLPDSA